MRKYLIIMLLAAIMQVSASLNVELSVKECAGVGANGYPISTIVPLPHGAFQDINHFQLTDGSGIPVPAQFEVLNRWWMGDKSIANLKVTYFPTVSAFTGSGTGITKYYLKDGGTGNPMNSALSVSETATLVTVTTGPLKFTVKKAGFNIIDELWFDKDNNGTYASSELVIKSNTHNGGEFIGRLPGDFQYDTDRGDLTFEVEKSGPLEAVIRVEALTKYDAPSDHLHGWAVRIHAYAGKSMLKVDYQLQNSAMTNKAGQYKKYTWPLYFHALNLNLDLNLSSNVTVKAGLGNGTVHSSPLGNGVCLAQRKDSLFGIYGIDSISDTSTILATGGRPDGFLEIDDGNIGVTAVTRNFFRMWPNGIKINSAKRLTVQLFPEWPVTTDARKPAELKSANLGWNYFWLNDNRKRTGTSEVGSFPNGMGKFWVTENPEDWLLAEWTTFGELNVRPQWMAQYNNERDFPSLELGTNNTNAGPSFEPYSWRHEQMGNANQPDSAFIANTAGTYGFAKPMNNAHAWYYAAYDAYWITGGCWQKDWYR